MKKFLSLLLGSLLLVTVAYAQKTVTKNADGTVTLPGSIISTPATITISAGTGSMIVTNRYSSATIIANTVITPSLTAGGAYNAGANGQTCSVYVTNSQGVVYTFQVNNSGTDYTVSVPASQSRWVTYISNGTDWIPTVADPPAVAAASTDLLYASDTTTRADKTVVASALVSAVLTAVPATVAQGGTGVATLTGIVKGSGTSNFAAAARSDYSTISLFGGATFAAPDTDTTETDIVAADCYGLILMYSPTTSGTVTLPAGAAGMSLIIMSANTSACEIIVDCDNADNFVLAGTAQADGVTINISAAAKGNYIAMIFDGTSWVTLGSSGTWIAGS